MKPIHQRKCNPRKCGGDFDCWGCGRRVGWCLGCADLLGEEHCDDCWKDRLAVLVRVSQGLATRGALGTRRPTAWQRKPLVVAEELRDEGFLRFARNGRFVLTESGRRAIAA